MLNLLIEPLDLSVADILILVGIVLVILGLIIYFCIRKFVKKRRIIGCSCEGKGEKLVKSYNKKYHKCCQEDKDK